MNKFNAAVIEKVFLIMKDSGSNPVKFPLSDLNSYFATIVAINGLKANQNYLNVDGERYLIEDYKIVSGLEALILPSEVLVTDSKWALDIRKRYDVEVKLFDPDEFERMSWKILNVWRASLDKVVKVERKKAYLSDVLERIVINGEVKKDACAPIEITIDLDDSFDDSYTNINPDKALLALIKQILLNL